MSPAALTLHEALEEQGRACAICQTFIAAGEQVGRCPGCDAPFHGECWDENGGCASYGCPEVPNVPKAEGPAEGSSYWGQEDKECPRCGRRIRLAALRCRHCGATFESRAPSAPRAPGASAAAKPTGSAAPWLLVLGLVPFTAPLVLVIGGLAVWLGRARVRRWPATRRAMAAVGLAAAAVVSILVGLVVLLHEPSEPAYQPAAAQEEEVERNGSEEESWSEDEPEESSEESPKTTE
jgi:hypothetical protein